MKTVIFDVDDTLVPFWEYLMKGIDIVFDKYILNSDISKQDFKKRYLELQNQLKPTKDSVDDYILIKKALESFGLDQNLAKNMHKELINFILNNTIPFEGTKQTLLELKQKGYRLGLMSNSIYLEKKLEIAKLDNIFDFMITPNDTGIIKPSKEFFEKLRPYITDPEYTYLVSDSYDQDLVPPKEMFNIKTIWLTKEQKTTQAPDHQINRIQDVLEHIP